MIKTKVLFFRTGEQRIRNAPKKRRRKFCYVIEILDRSSPEILEIMTLFPESHHLAA